MERIGKYEIRQLLGEGATSSVYLGYDPFAQRDVAIKRLHPHLARDPELASMLVDEARPLDDSECVPHEVRADDR